MIGEIEQKIIDTIKSANLGYKFKCVESYKANFDDDILTLVKTSSPAVWVVFNGDTASTLQGDNAVKATFSLILLSKNLRNEKASRFGAKGEVGAYQMISDLRALLNDNDLGLYITPLEYKSSTSLLNTKVSQFNTSVFELSFETTFPIKKFNEVADDFETLQTTWEIPEFTSETTVTYERS